MDSWAWAYLSPYPAHLLFSNTVQYVKVKGTGSWEDLKERWECWMSLSQMWWNLSGGRQRQQVHCHFQRCRNHIIWHCNYQEQVWCFWRFHEHDQQVEKRDRLSSEARAKQRGGGEYMKSTFSNWLRAKGIIHKHSNPYKPEQNGVAERLNCTISEMGRTMPAALHLPQDFWSFAYVTACYLHNWLHNSLTRDKTPFELV